MSLEPLLRASPVIQVHAGCAVAGIVIVAAGLSWQAARWRKTRQGIAFVAAH